MPELPETETIARDLDRAIRGAVVSDVTITHADVLREVSPQDLGRRTAGARIDGCWRRAKLVVLDLSTGDRVVVQPRFTGALLIDDGELPTAERRYSTLAFHLSDGRRLHYRDIRRLGTVTLMARERFATYSAGIGPEPLDPTFTTDNFRDVLRSSRQAIKKVLMDQRQLAGVGNIYATESLWRAGIDPSRSASRVPSEDAAALRDALVDVLREAIAARGTSFRDYRDARGARGAFAERLAAYGRAGLPCRRCQRRLIGTHAIDSRMTVFCAHCQH
jgi:formamidopyrimidine-DNA glycosylase